MLIRFGEKPETLIAYFKTNSSTALANPSSSIPAVTYVADFFTSSLACPIATEYPLFLNIKTSFGMSPIVIISAGGIFRNSESHSTTDPLFAFG